MPSDFTLKTMNAVHRGLLKISGGKAGGRVANMPVLELTTIGRESGQRRSVMLTSPIQQGTMLVVVASRGGDDGNPAGRGRLPRQACAADVRQGGERRGTQPPVAAGRGPSQELRRLSGENRA
jgi:F420H(2)-dependent quinone reductase